jgi:hypothetical protein
MPIHLDPATRELDDGTFLAVVVVTDHDLPGSWDAPVPNDRRPTQSEALQAAREHADALWQMGEDAIRRTNPAR